MRDGSQGFFGNLRKWKRVRLFLICALARKGILGIWALYIAASNEEHSGSTPVALPWILRVRGENWYSVQFVSSIF